MISNGLAEPYWLYVGVVVILGLCALMWHLSRLRQHALEQFASVKLVQVLTESVSVLRRRIKAAALLLGVALVFVALARPQWGFRWEEVRRRGIDILLAVDTSRSMLAKDIAPDRLQRAKLGIYDFISRLEGDRVGLIPFSGSSFLMCPLTMDYNAFEESLNALDTTIIPRGGTDIATAIQTAVRTFDEGETNFKILILVTDGEDLEGSALSAAQDAAAKGVKIYTIGVGTPAGEIIPIQSKRGIQYVKDESGNVVKSKLDESMLRQIAEATGGFYSPLGQRGEGLDAIYRDKLSLIPKEELTQRMRKVPLERFQWPLLFAIILLGMELLIRDRKGRMTSTQAAASMRTAVSGTGKAALSAWAVGMLLLASPTQASAAAHSQGWWDYQIGKFGSSKSAYSHALSEQPENGTLLFNHGAASYKAKNLDPAEASFRKALDSHDISLQNKAYYNLGNTIYKQGEATLNSDTSATIKKWEEALKAYDAAMKLNPEDEQAQSNYELVKKKIEILKKQQQQQDQQDQQQQQNQQNQQNPQQNQGGEGNNDQQQQNSDPKNDPKDNPQNSKQKQNQDSQNPQQPQNKQPPPPNQPDQPDQPDQKQNSENKPKDGKAQPGNKQGHKPQAAQRKPGEMSQAEARRLLESLKGEERKFYFLPQEAQRPNDPRNQRNW